MSLLLINQFSTDSFLLLICIVVVAIIAVLIIVAKIKEKKKENALISDIVSTTSRLLKEAEKQRKSQSFCSDCLRYFFFDEDITYDLGEESWSEEKDSNGRHYIQYSRGVALKCTCSKCGKTQDAFCVAYTRRTGLGRSVSKWEENENIQNCIKKHFHPAVFDRTISRDVPLDERV